MQITKGGELYGYCPAKATWDHSASAMYQALVITAETGIMLEEGAINDQPEWWIDLLSWFLPYYSDQKFYARARAILGDGGASATADSKITKGAKNGRNNR